MSQIYFKLNSFKKHQNLWDIAYSALKGQYVTLNACIIWKKLSQVDDHNFYLKSVENKAQVTPNGSKGKEIIDTRAKNQ